MILVDSRVGSVELAPIIRRLGLRCETGQLEFGDACCEANGPDGAMLVGIERKTLHDLLHCIDDSRYAAHQLPGMKASYALSFLVVEGSWKPHDPEGWLMEGFQGGTSWGLCRYRSQKTLYSKLYRYLLSVSLSGVTVTVSRDIFQTAFNICEIYHYFSKKWSDHTSMIETQKLNLPELTGKPSLVRRWAADLEGIGVKYSLEAERIFRKPIRLATADEIAWVGVGVPFKVAQSVVKEINGWQR